MSEAPERIVTNYNAKIVVTDFYRHETGVEYIRADIHAAEIAKLQARIKELESKYQDVFQMHVDSNEDMLDAKAELQEMRMQTLASLGQAQEAYEAQVRLEKKLKLALDKLKAVDKWVEELGMYAPPETSRVPVFKDLPKLIEELSR